MAVNKTAQVPGEAGRTDLSGLLSIDKPSQWTSHDVVAKLRAALRIRKVGHTGTLDPMATGVLLICLGRATRMSQFLVGLEKEYLATLRFGAESDTLDAEGHIVLRPNAPTPRLEEIQDVFHLFRGHIEQIPPMFSAIKHRGQPLYRFARQGQTVLRRSRPVTIRSLEIRHLDPPRLTFQVACSSGTYVRALAADIGQKLGCGAYLEDLRRLRVGNFRAEDALPLDRALALAGEGNISEHVLPLNRGLANYPRMVVHAWAASDILGGRSLGGTMVQRCDPKALPGDTVRVEDTRGKLLAMARLLIGPKEFSQVAHHRPICQFLRVLSP
jgi:tRNA pseudouridine55 synthase